jgi:hypothetical protein
MWQDRGPWQPHFTQKYSSLAKRTDWGADAAAGQSLQVLDGKRIWLVEGKKSIAFQA